MDASLTQAVCMAIAVGAASGAVGSFIILRRMALVGDALSHVALPGIALALAYSVDPFWMVLAFLLGAAALIWFLEGRTKIPVDAIVGLLFTSSLAIGILTIPNTEILESLFGVFPQLPLLELGFIITAAFAITMLVFFFSQKTLFTIISPELSRVSGIGVFAGLISLLIFSFVVAIGIKLVGTLLMGALTIIPAAIAKNLSRSSKSYIVFATVFGAVISVVGVTAAATLHFLPGPTIILFGAGLFLVSLGFVRLRKI